jgi:hypothetical protein
MGIDVTDLMRQIRLTTDPSDEDTLDLDPEYAKSVEESHVKYLAELDEKMRQKNSLEGVSPSA